MKLIGIFRNENVLTPEPIDLWDGLTFTSLQNGSTIYFTESSTGNRYVQYSIDGVTWDNLGTTAHTFNYGQLIFIRAAFTSSTNYSSTPQFKMTGKWKASGKICSLLYTDNTYTETLATTPGCAFSRLFYGLTALYDVSELSFEGITRFGGTGCCRMFYGCSNIEKITVSGPTDVNGNDYALQYMFNGCSKLSYIAFPTAIYNTTATAGRMYYFTADVSYTGTFVKKSGVTWPSGTSGIPTGWTVVEV